MFTFAASLDGWIRQSFCTLRIQHSCVRRNRSVAEVLDAFLVSHDRFSNHTVAETIFPGYEYLHRGIEGVYRVYPDEIYPKIKNHPEMRRWGAYAYRLLRRRDEFGTTFNPLASCIEKMKDKVPKRAAYEVGTWLWIRFGRV